MGGQDLDADLSDSRTHTDFPEILYLRSYTSILSMEIKMVSEPNELMGQDVTDVMPSQIASPWYYSGDCGPLWPKETGLVLQELTHVDKGLALEGLTWGPLDVANSFTLLISPLFDILLPLQAFSLMPP